jgi:hypothetical protein
VTFLDNLQSHKGGLIKLKTQLYWYDGRGWDNNPGRICLLLDAEAVTTFTGLAAPAATAAGALATAAAAAPAATAARLLIEGQPQWIWLAEKDIDLLVNDTPTN